MWESPLYIHFIVWFSIVFLLFSIGFWLPQSDNPNLNQTRAFIGVTISSILLSTAFTSMRWFAKKAEEYYIVLARIENEATNSTTSDELLKIRKVLLKHWRKNSFHRTTGAESERVLQMIDTRLTYEFKLKSK